VGFGVSGRGGAVVVVEVLLRTAVPGDVVVTVVGAGVVVKGAVGMDVERFGAKRCVALARPITGPLNGVYDWRTTPPRFP
jgi:uncharacterized membrane protein